MIVRRHQDQLLLIRQPDHAHLSRTLMTRWTRDGFADHPRREIILLATGEHDNGWTELDEAPILDTASGRILDFIQAPDDVRQSVWPRGVHRLQDEPYAAALVAQHALNVYRDNRDDPAWSGFMAHMEDLRGHYLGLAAPLGLDELLGDYFFVRMGDLVSLFFANGWPGPRTETGYTVRGTPEGLGIEPDPFDGTRVPMTLAGRVLPSAPFADAGAAKRAYDAASTVILTATASGA